MAHRKAGGSAKNLRDSNPKYLGVKRANGQGIIVGEVIVRQRGTKLLAGANVGIGSDHTLFAKKNGIVRFKKTRKTSFTGAWMKRLVVSVE